MRSAFVAAWVERIGIFVVVGLFFYLLYAFTTPSMYIQASEGGGQRSERQDSYEVSGIANLRTPFKSEQKVQRYSDLQGDGVNQVRDSMKELAPHEPAQSVNELENNADKSAVGKVNVAKGQVGVNEVQANIGTAEKIEDGKLVDQYPGKDLNSERGAAFPANGAPANDKVIPNIADTGQVSNVVQTQNKLSGYKTIHFWVNVYGNDLVKEHGPDTSRAFQGCPVKTCQMTNEPDLFDAADAVFVDIRHMVAKQVKMPTRKSPDQIWIFFDIEPPVYFPQIRELSLLNGAFNATLTYSPDATMPMPYFHPYRRISAGGVAQQSRNFATGRTKLLMWIVSNCGSRSQREIYAAELSRYIPVDVVGGCAQKFKWNNLYNKTTCEGEQRDACIDTMGQTYKFYFASENSICPEYVTEKLSKALDLDIVPIVLGGANYRELLPPKSYIDVRDFNSPADLAEYLLRLDKDDALYNAYFQWKSEWEKTAGEDYLCKVCSYIHSSPPRQIKSVQQWYDPNTCTPPAKYFLGHSGNITFVDHHHGGAI